MKKNDIDPKRGFPTCKHCGRDLAWANWLYRWVHASGLRVECVWEAEPK